MEYLPRSSTLFHHHSHSLCDCAQWFILHSADELLSLLCCFDAYAYSLQFLQVYFMGSVCIALLFLLLFYDGDDIFPWILLILLFISFYTFILSFLTNSTFMIVIKFIFQTSFFSQYLSNGVWKIAGLVHEMSETIFVPDPFQWIHVIGIYKTDDKYVCIFYEF